MTAQPSDQKTSIISTGLAFNGASAIAISSAFQRRVLRLLSQA